MQRSNWLFLIAAVPVFFADRTLAATYEGFTEPYLKANLKIAERGTVAAIHVSEGAEVKAGDLILELDSRVLQSSLKIAEARKKSNGSLAAAKARRALMNTHLERLVDLNSQGHAQFDELAKARADAEVAAAEVRIASDDQKIHALEFDRLKQQIEIRKLYAPFSGVVTRIYPTLGESVNLDSEFLATLVQLDKLSITLHIKAADVHRLNVSENVTPVCPRSSQDSSGAVNAIVEQIAAVIDPDSGTIRVKLLVDNQNGVLRSGLKCAFDI